MLVLNIPFFICMLCVQVITKIFPGGRRPFGRSLKHDEYQTLATMTSKFLQVGVLVFDGSGQTCPMYPIFLKRRKKNCCSSFCILLLWKTFGYLMGFQSCLLLLVSLHSQTVCIFCMNTAIQ